jgi:hypothetical protein
MRFPFSRPPPPPPAAKPPTLREQLLAPEYLPYLAAVAALLLALRLFWPRRRPASFSKVPGALPLLGNALQLGQPEALVERFEEWLDEHGQDGVCECTLAGMRYIIVGGHDAVMELMRQRPDRVVCVI